MTTIFSHPAVEKYLADLDQALPHTSTEHAGDLRDQVREHLEEALPGDATDAQIEDTLARLGPPDGLVAGEDEPRAAVLNTPLSLIDWLKQRPKKWWAGLIAIAVVVVAASAAVTVEQHIAPLQAGCQPCGLAVPEDRTHVHFNSVGALDELRIPQRFGQDQAFKFTIYNPSKFAQRVSGGLIGIPFGTAEPVSLDIATISQGRENLSNDWPRDFVTHAVSIPSHSYQQVVLHWLQNVCHTPGRSETMTGIELKVQTLAVTRSETVSFGEAFTIVAPISAGHCREGSFAHGRFRTSL